MSELADLIIEANNQQLPPRPKIFSDIKFDSEVDELGIPVSDIDDYFVARILLIDYKGSDQHLYVKDGKVYRGRDEIKCNATNLIKLAKWRYPLKPHLVPWLWDRMVEFLPEYSRDKFVVAPGVTWDRRNAELTNEDERYTI